jgi:hypothetical protein
MIQITPQMRILVALEAVDGRKGIDSLARLCQEKLRADPFSGCLFVFRSRRGTAIRILVYDLCEVPRYVKQLLQPSHFRAIAVAFLHITCFLWHRDWAAFCAQLKGGLDAHDQITVSTGIRPICIVVCARGRSRRSVRVVEVKRLSRECDPPARLCRAVS